MRKVKVRDLKRVILAMHIGSRFEPAPGGGSHFRFYTAENRMYPVPAGNGLNTDLDWVYVKKICKLFAIDEEELKKQLQRPARQAGFLASPGRHLASPPPPRHAVSMDPVDHRPRARDTSHLLDYGLEWIAVDDEEHGSGAYAHPPAGGCATAYENGAWLALHRGGRRIDGRIDGGDENAARRAAIEALGGKVT